MGAHKYLFNTPVHGYQGYIVANNIHFYTQPTELEFKQGVVPDKIFVIGKGLVKPIKEFHPNAIVEVAPGFRFQKIWSNKIINTKSKTCIILVALPMDMSEAINILLLLNSYFNTINNNPAQFLIKPHPTKTDIILKFIESLEQKHYMKIVIGDFAEAALNANIVITNASSVSVEALAMSVPVILVAPPTGILQNPIPSDINNKFWKVVKNANELSDAIYNYNKFTLEELKEIESDKIKLNYFEPITENRVSQFLNL